MFFLKRAITISIFLSAFLLMGAEVDNQDYDGVRHDWSWAVNEVNSAGDSSITFNLPDAQATINSGSFTEEVWIDGANSGGTNITCNGTLTLGTGDCMIENMASINTIECSGGSSGNMFSYNKNIENITGKSDDIFLYSNKIVNADLGTYADVSFNQIEGNVKVISGAKFYNNTFYSGSFNGGSLSEITSNVVASSTATITISNSCEVSSCNAIELEVNGNNNTISKCGIKYNFEINGNNNLIDDCDVTSTADLSIAGSNNTIQNSSFSGNRTGIRVLTNSTDTTIIGCNVFNNSEDGILILGELCQVGDTSGNGNIIYQNTGNGVAIIDTKDIDVYGNYIGTIDSTSTNDVGNMIAGVYIYNSENVRVGQYVVSGQNEIRYNKGGGIKYKCDDNINHNISIENNIFRQNIGSGIQLDGGDNINITANYIGTDATDANDKGNIGPGIYIKNSTSVKIGGIIPAARNIISANLGDGIFFDGEDTNDFSGGIIQGNYIGSTRNGNSPLPNNGNGILLSRAWGITIGDGQPGAANVISGNAQAGIRLQIGNDNNSGENIIQGNYIGTGPDGTNSVPNAVGIYLSGISNTVGGTATNQRNIISGNYGDGIQLALDGSSSTEYTAYNIIQGNYIGIDVAGSFALPNGGNGIAVYAPAYFVGQVECNEIGGTNGSGYTARNIISGNTSNGINFSYGESNNLIDGNYIGLSADGLSAVGNGENGIVIGALTNYYGNVAVGTREGNVISGNGIDGIRLYMSSSTIKNNLIGAAPDYSKLLPNGGNGINLTEKSYEAVVGNNRYSGGNIIVGNNGDGIVDSGGGNIIAGNWIGLCPAPADCLAPNQGTYGIHILNGSSSTIGGNGITGNVINAEIGIGIESAVYGAPDILGNVIGFNPDTTLVSTNLRIGILGQNINNLQIGADTTDSGNHIGAAEEYGILLKNCIGGSVTASRIGCASNISGFVTNAGHGIVLSNCLDISVGEVFNTLSMNYIAGSDIGLWMQNCNNCWVHYSWIGITPDKTILGNRSDGIRIDGGDYNRVGEYSTNIFSVISANNGVGIRVSDANRFHLYGTMIGTDPAGISARSNLQGGVLVVNSTNSILGLNPYINLISGNNNFGIRIEGTNSQINTISDNRIGLALNTESAIPNLGDGIIIDNAADNTISKNTIWNNASNGVSIIGNLAMGNKISQNSIYRNGVRGISLGAGGNTNDYKDPDIGPNNIQNYPVITNAYRGSTVIYGTFNGKPNHDYQLEYFTSEDINSSGFAEGQNYIDNEWITTDTNGNYSINAWIYRTSTTGMIVTAVAIDSDTGDTSEFSFSTPYAKVKVAPDSNGDGIPDFYEQMYPAMAAAHSQGSDYDNDGVSDLEEYLAFTNPEDGTKYFMVTISTNSINIPDSSMGREYTIERTTNLLGNIIWTPVTSKYEGNEFLLQIPVNTETEPSKSLYRGRVEIP